MNKAQREQHIRALLHERQGAVTYGKDDTVREIDAELKKVGYEAKTPAQRAEKMAAPQRGDNDAKAEAPDTKSEAPDTEKPTHRGRR